MQTPMIDFHTHIIPNIDDGSDSVETSLALLQMLKNEGVKIICLTPHFCAVKEKSIDDYIKKRNKQYKLLKPIDKEIKLKIGAEIYYYYGISKSTEVDKLCLEDTKILLIELPSYIKINQIVIDEILKLQSDGYEVMIAHVERTKLNNKQLELLHRKGVHMQVNTEYMRDFITALRVNKMMKKNYIDAIGSDCHDIDKRKPEYEKAINYIKMKNGEDCLNNIIKKGYEMIERTR